MITGASDYDGCWSDRMQLERGKQRGRRAKRTMFPDVPMGEMEWIIMMMMNRATRSRSRLSADYEETCWPPVPLSYSFRFHGNVRMRLKAKFVCELVLPWVFFCCESICSASGRDVMSAGR